MAGLNKITLIGNVGRDPEVRDYNGNKVASFSLAITERYNKNGVTQERTDWFRVSFWGQQSEIVEKYVRKGGQVYVEGKLSASTYTDKNNQVQVSLEVRGNVLQLLGGPRNDGASSDTHSGTASGGHTVPIEPPFVPETSNNDDLPF